jgi:hypothetical protein
VKFEDEAGNTGNALLTIDRIDKTVPKVQNVQYSTTEATNQPVQVVVRFDEAVVLPTGWLAMDSQTITRTFTTNT